MTENKKTVMKYMDGFRESNHVEILSCLTNDVEWIIPGMFHKKGQEEFDKEIENDNFTGKPDIEVTRLIEEKNIVIAEGSVSSKLKNGEPFRVVFCDVFEFENGKIKKLISYLMQIK